MQNAICQLFAKIIKFSQEAIKHYKKGRLAKSFSAVVKPFSLSFKHLIDDISQCSRHVDELANSASKAEIRDLHIQVQRLEGLALSRSYLLNL
jgi:hypothetical protein